MAHIVWILTGTIPSSSTPIHPFPMLWGVQPAMATSCPSPQVLMSLSMGGLATHNNMGGQVTPTRIVTAIPGLGGNQSGAAGLFLWWLDLCHQPLWTHQVCPNWWQLPSQWKSQSPSSQTSPTNPTLPSRTSRRTSASNLSRTKNYGSRREKLLGLVFTVPLTGLDPLAPISRQTQTLLQVFGGRKLLLTSVDLLSPIYLLGRLVLTARDTHALITLTVTSTPPVPCTLWDTSLI